jgi:hypothetical protein
MQKELRTVDFNDAPEKPELLHSTGEFASPWCMIQEEKLTSENYPRVFQVIC